jgi:dipeptidyl aminopeptidase/acylaminoacyl peptidase
MNQILRPLLGAAALLSLAAVPAHSAPAGKAARIERGQLLVENVPETPPEVRDRLQQYVNTRGASFQGFTPDGGVLITTRFADAAQVHKVDFPLGARRQLTFFRDPVGGASVRPGGSDLVFSKDQGGDEFFQVFHLDPSSGRITQFTEDGYRNQGATWRRDGGLVAWSRAGKDSGDYDILAANPADPGTRRQILDGKGAISPIDWSPDGTKLLIGESISVTKSRRFLLDAASGVLDELTPDLDVAYRGGEFSADGQSVYLVSDEGSDFARLIRLDLSSGARTVLSPQFLPHDVEGFDLSPDGRRLAYTVNVDGASALRVLDVSRGAPRELTAPTLPPGVIGGLEFDAKGERLGLTLNSSTSPSDVYVFDLKSKKLTRWTQSEVGGLDPERFVEPSLVRFPTFDSASGGPKEITAWLYQPTTPGPHPVVVSIHGGPEGQSRPTFSSNIQYWVNELGLAVLLPNVRGSTGYGKAFVDLDNGMKREDSVKDIGALLDFIARDPARFDASRVIAYGGSYGGYMVYASMIMFPERFAAGVDIVGISNFVTFLENTSGYRRDLRRVEYGDERDPAMREHLIKISPLTKASALRRPMFIIQGYNDPRVPYTEAEQMLAALRRNGVEAWFMMARDEGHGFAKKSNQDAQREAETLFFEKFAGVGKAAGH